MVDQRADEFARCAGKLALALRETQESADPFEAVTEDADDAFAPSLAGREGIFDQALTNGLLAIVAHEWPGEEVEAKGRNLAASGLLKVILKHVPEDGSSGVYVILDPDRATPTPQGSEDAPSIFQRRQLPPIDTRIDVRVLLESLDVSQPARHGRGRGGLQRRHVAALVALDDHISLQSMSEAEADLSDESANDDDRRSASQARALLELIGDDEASRRAEEADNPNAYHPKSNPDGHDFTTCPVCQYETFCVQGTGIWGQIGFGQCVVCSYIRSPRTADREGFIEHIDWIMSKD